MESTTVQRNIQKIAGFDFVMVRTGTGVCRVSDRALTRSDLENLSSSIANTDLHVANYKEVAIMYRSSLRAGQVSSFEHAFEEGVATCDIGFEMDEAGPYKILDHDIKTLLEEQQRWFNLTIRDVDDIVKNKLFGEAESDRVLLHSGKGHVTLRTMSIGGNAYLEISAGSIFKGDDRGHVILLGNTEEAAARQGNKEMPTNNYEDLMRRDPDTFIGNHKYCR